MKKKKLKLTFGNKKLSLLHKIYKFMVGIGRYIYTIWCQDSKEQKLSKSLSMAYIKKLHINTIGIRYKKKQHSNGAISFEKKKK